MAAGDHLVDPEGVVIARNGTRGRVTTDAGSVTLDGTIDLTTPISATSKTLRP